MSGTFITFEGGEGAGKSTQILRLTDHFNRLGRDVVTTREPGGTRGSEEIRAALVTGEPGKWSSTAEALLNYAARDAHLRELIRPALADGKTVLCDRFMDSTRAYQAIAGNCPLSLIVALEETVVGSTRPNLTFVFDLDPALGLARAKQRGAGAEDRYDRRGLEYHAAVRRGFLGIAADEPKRCVIVDAGQGPDAVFASLLAQLRTRGHG